MRDYSEGPGWSAMTSWLLAFVLLFVGFMVADARGGSGIIDPEFVGTVIFLVVCVPIFFLGVGAGIIAITQRQPWGYAAVLLNVIVMAGLIFLRFGSSPPDAPAAQAEREKQLRDRQRTAAEAKRRRDNGDISLSEDSLAYQIVTAPWWRLGCASVVGMGTVIWAGGRLRRRGARPNPVEPVSAETLPQTYCPKCKGDVTQALASGGSFCPACNTQFVIARGTAASASSFRDSALGELLFDGSAVQRVGALLLVSMLVILGLVWSGLMLFGQWIASKNVFAVMFFLGMLLAVMVAQYARRQN